MPIPVKPDPFRHPMPRLSGRLAGVGPIKIVAIGSSTTAGEDDIVLYPFRLEQALRKSYQGRNIDVSNRGVGGEEAPEELNRLQRDVLDERPSVVIWQVGTNAAWKHQDLNATADAIRQGLAMLADAYADVVLMDLQYTPAVLTSDTKRDAERMVDLIDCAADQAGFPVNVFHRFSLMREWVETKTISFDRIVDPTDESRLHHNDWSACHMAKDLATTIVTAASAAA